LVEVSPHPRGSFAELLSFLHQAGKQVEKKAELLRSAKSSWDEEGMKEMDLFGLEKIGNGQLSEERQLPVTGWLFNEFGDDQATAERRRLVN
jgi:hypothetical protein